MRRSSSSARSLLAPRANITSIDNDLTAWFSRDDPIYREYERFQDEFGGTRTLIVAIDGAARAIGCSAARPCSFSTTSAAEIERVDDGRARRQPGDRDARRRRGRPTSPDAGRPSSTCGRSSTISASKSPRRRSADRALADELLQRRSRLRGRHRRRRSSSSSTSGGSTPSAPR